MGAPTAARTGSSWRRRLVLRPRGGGDRTSSQRLILTVSGSPADCAGW